MFFALESAFGRSCAPNRLRKAVLRDAEVSFERRRSRPYLSNDFAWRRENLTTVRQSRKAPEVVLRRFAQSYKPRDYRVDG